jgi:hypothetical protein
LAVTVASTTTGSGSLAASLSVAATLDVLLRLWVFSLWVLILWQVTLGLSWALVKLGTDRGMEVLKEPEVENVANIVDDLCHEKILK